MTLSSSESIIIIAVVAVLTFLTRAFPFVLFGRNKKVPDIIQYLGKILPPAIIATLVVYCVKKRKFLYFSQRICGNDFNRCCCNTTSLEKE